jgi:hypothetical protein
MFKIDKSTVLRYYRLGVILGLFLYNIIIHSIPEFSNDLIQLAIGLNVIFASYYLLYKDDFILNVSESLKSFFVACAYEYILIWELVKLLGKSQELTIYYTNYAYLGLILVHLGLYHRIPKFFDIFLKFNVGFSYGYIITNYLKKYDYIHILASVVVSIIWNYLNELTLDIMAVYCRSFICSIAVLQASMILVKLADIDNGIILGIAVAMILNISFYIYLSTTISQVKNLENKGDGEDLENQK